MEGLESLNPPQREAVLHGDGPLVVFAGAGSGKTRVITHRVAHLVSERDVRPWRVLAVTFTNKAAQEMRHRLFGLLGDEASDARVGTFHATCARLLRRHGELLGLHQDFSIYDDQDQQALLKRVMRDLSIDDKRHPAKGVAGQINRAKQEVIGPGEFSADDVRSEVAKRVYGVYEQRLRDANALDFGDLITVMVRGLEKNEEFSHAIRTRFSYVLVDEFQDTNHAQFRLVRALVKDHHNICVVGDDDQSIYRWRGADRRNILDFRDAFPDARLIKLEQNYRSTKRILRAANAVISRNTDREPKELWTDNDEGDEIVVVRTADERDEARLVQRGIEEFLTQGHALADIVVFYRTHAQSRVIEEVLRGADVPYRIVGGMRFYDRAEVKDLLAYLRVLQNPADDVSLLRIINTPTRGIGKTTIHRVLDHAARFGIGTWEALARTDELDVGAAARKKLKAFVALIEELRGLAGVGGSDGGSGSDGDSANDSRSDADSGGATERRQLSLGELGAEVAERSGYLEALRADDSPEADARMQNLQELVASMEEFVRERPDGDLAAFLENVTLQTSADEAAEGDRVTLMTVHAAKGLEFPIVFVTGLEEQVFPFRGVDPWDDPEELEEERRLAYVAFTRARQRLILSFAAFRRLFGQQRVGLPSRFLAELPDEDVEWIGLDQRPNSEAAEVAALDRSYEQYEDLSTSVRKYGQGDHAKASRSPRESYVDYEDVDSGEMIRRGMRVKHKKFGIGEVRDVVEGSPPRVTVRFPGFGERKIVATFLEPA